MIPVWLVLAALVPLGALVALLDCGARARRGLAVALACGALVLPLSAVGPPLALGFAALLAVLIVFRSIDLFRERIPRTAAQRVWHVLGIVDTRLVRRAPPAWSWSRAIASSAWTALSIAAAYLACRVAPSLSIFERDALRWSAGIVFAYASFEALVATVELAYRAAGFQLPILHDAPILSRTIAEFWSQRWNRIVSTWLRATLFVPLARRREARLGLFAAFAVSVALHGYVAWAALGHGFALSASIFFAAQIPLLVVERQIGVARWPAFASRAWTIAWLCALSPLFTEPVMSVFDPFFA